jgi:hypothetical protein
MPIHLPIRPASIGLCQPCTCVLYAELNPLPFAATVSSNCGWIAYAFVTQNRFLVSGSYVSLLLGLFFTLSAYGYADAKVG